MFILLETLAERLSKSYFMIDGQEDKNALADVLGRTPLNKLVAYYATLDDRQRKNFGFVVNQVLDQDSAWNILSLTVFAAKIDAEVAGRTKRLQEEVSRLELKNERLISEAEDANLELSAAVASLTAATLALEETETDNARLQDYILCLQTEVDTVREFKRSLKQLLIS